MKLWTFFLFMYWMTSDPVCAFDEPTFIIESESFHLNQANDYSYGSFAARLTEDEWKAALNQGLFIKKSTYELFFQKYFYFAYVIENRLDRPVDTFILLPGLLPESQLYTYRDGQIIPWEKFPSRFDAFHANIPPGKTVVLGHRLSGGTFTGKASEVQAFDFYSLTHHLRQQEHVIAWLLGAVFIMVFYSLITFILFRRTYFLYYAAYSFFSLIALTAFSGQVEFHVRWFSLFNILSTVSLLTFAKLALSLDRHLLACARLYYPLILVLVICSALGWWLANIFIIAVGTTLAIFYCVICSWMRWRQGYQPAAILLLGWFSLGTGLLLSLLNFTIWGLPYLNWSLLLGYALELLFFSLAIQQKARLSEQKTLRANEHAFLQLQKVFYPHQIEQMKLGAQLESTMPTGPSEACVLAFDVIGSSRIPPDKAKSFLEDALKSCLSLLSQGYDPKTLIARGYRIKEMGDGFLCSVGYPFANADGLSKEESVVRLAWDMIKTFQEVSRKHFEKEQIYCAIGIASGSLESFFPKEGTREYDVYGRAIVLATRYEAARKALFVENPPGHLIILQTQVYKGLPHDLQEDFCVLDLKNQAFKIRDDEQATELAYQLVASEDPMPHPWPRVGTP